MRVPQNGWFRSLESKILLKWMIWRYPYFRKPPYEQCDVHPSIILWNTGWFIGIPRSWIMIIPNLLDSTIPYHHQPTRVLTTAHKGNSINGEHPKSRIIMEHPLQTNDFGTPMTQETFFFGEYWGSSRFWGSHQHGQVSFYQVCQMGLVVNIPDCFFKILVSSLGFQQVFLELIPMAKSLSRTKFKGKVGL